MDLQKLRSEIEKTDQKIMKLLKKRLKLSEKISHTKIKNGLRIFDQIREKKLHELYEKSAKSLGVPKNFIKKIFNIILDQSRKIQSKSKASKKIDDETKK